MFTNRYVLFMIRKGLKLSVKNIFLPVLKTTF
ncbi:hypothetical protein CLV99_0559 [Sphingobacterium yanglingense]|uniref:Uncharacterized protein n=1 Tax=Sphingobacterium yanglingense TaxID=1437280 RepID=A0A4R6WJN9_9SPHI|nr:hypothetical protein CLV99_0559 [Sphingobacterium yanglingense]